MSVPSVSKSKKKSASHNLDQLLMILTVVFGTFVRIWPILHSNFPLEDGGMFLTMVRDLQTAGFRLPAFTSYNHQQIPYAYPPFAFYATGLLNSLTGIPILTIIQWQPVLINILTIGVIYKFSERYTQSTIKAWLASFIFAMTPNSYWWLIVGGGLTRSFGALFAFSFAYFSYRLYHDQEGSLFVLSGAILSGALTVLSHLEWALQAVFIGLLFFWYWGITRVSVKKTALLISAIFLLTLPWWGRVIQLFGIRIFYLASTATANRLLFFIPLLGFQYTGENIPLIAVLILIGVFVAFVRKEYLLLIWGIGGIIVDPRGGVPSSVLPFSLLAMYVITDLIAPYFLHVSGQNNIPWWNFSDLPIGKFFLGVFSILCVFHAYEVSNALVPLHLSDAERQAMAWVKENSRPGDTFLVFDWEENPNHSFVSEWFPSLADRRSITTVQGQEWFGTYHHTIDLYSQYQQCLQEDLSCVLKVEAETQTHANCIFISFQNSAQQPEFNLLYESLVESPQYSSIFSSSEIQVFCRLK